MVNTYSISYAVEQRLNSFPNIVIVGEPAITKYPPDKYSGPLRQMIEYKVAPREGLYTEKELQLFMRGLIGDIRLSGITDFQQHNGRLHFGSVHLDDVIDEQRIRIVIRVYPNEDIACHDKYKYGIDLRDLKKYHHTQEQGILHRIGELVHHPR